MSIAGMTGLSPVKRTLPEIVPPVASSMLASGREGSGFSDAGWLLHAHTSSVEMRSSSRDFKCKFYFDIKLGVAPEVTDSAH